MKTYSIQTYQGPLNRAEWDKIESYKVKVNELKEEIANKDKPTQYNQLKTGSFPAGETPKKGIALEVAGGYDNFSPATFER